MQCRASTSDFRSIWLILLLSISSGSYLLALQQPVDLPQARQKLKDAVSANEKQHVIEQLNNLGWLFQSESQYDSSAHYYKKAIELTFDPDFLSARTTALLGAGESYMRMFENDSSSKYLTLALSAAQQMNDSGLIAGVYNSLANNFLNENQLNDALSHFVISANIYDSLNDQKGLSKALSNIGNIEYRLDHLDKASDYARRSIMMAIESSHESGVAYGHKLLGWIRRKQGDYKGAIQQYDSSLVVYRRMGMKRDVAEIAVSLGNAKYDLMDYIGAIENYQEALRSCIQSGYKPFLPYTYSGLTYSYYALKNYDKALIYSDSLTTTAKGINSYLLLDAYNLKSAIYEDQKDFEKALIYSKQYQQLKDSLTANENRKALEEATARFENEQKQNEIELLKKNQALQNIQLSQSRAILFATILVLVSVIVIAGLLINRYRIINRTKRQLELEKMRNAIARDLHDDIGSALSSINIASQIGATGNQKSPDEIFNRIREQSSKVMEGMSDIVWSINPENDELGKVASKMKEFAVEILEPKGIDLTFHLANFTGITLDSEKRKNIFLIFKEALNNAAKYSGCSKVAVSLSCNHQSIQLEIADDGAGFDKDQAKSGNGLRNMKYRAELLNGTFELNSEKGKGTRINLNLPIT